MRRFIVVLTLLFGLMFSLPTPTQAVVDIPTNDGDVTGYPASQAEAIYVNGICTDAVGHRDGRNAVEETLGGLRTMGIFNKQDDTNCQLVDVNEARNLLTSKTFSFTHPAVVSMRNQILAIYAENDANFVLVIVGYSQGSIIVSRALESIKDSNPDLFDDYVSRMIVYTLGQAEDDYPTHSTNPDLPYYEHHWMWGVKPCNAISCPEPPDIVPGIGNSFDQAPGEITPVEPGASQTQLANIIFLMSEAPDAYIENLVLHFVSDDEIDLSGCDYQEGGVPGIKRHSFCLYLRALNNPVVKGNVAITGTILDATGAPVNNAAVSSAAGRTSYTNSEGIYRLSATQGSNTLTISKPGYAPQTVSYNAPGIDQNTLLTFVDAPDLSLAWEPVQLASPQNTLPAAETINVTWPHRINADEYAMNVYGSITGEVASRVVDAATCTDGICAETVTINNAVGDYEVWIQPRTSSVNGPWGQSTFTVIPGGSVLSAPVNVLPPTDTIALTFPLPAGAYFVVADVYYPNGGYTREVIEAPGCPGGICVITVPSFGQWGDYQVWLVSGYWPYFGQWTSSTFRMGAADVSLTFPTGSTPVTDPLDLVFDMPPGAYFVVADVYYPNGGYTREVIEVPACPGGVCTVSVPSYGLTGDYSVWLIPGWGSQFGNWALSTFTVTGASLSTDTVDVLGSAIEAPPALDTSQVEAAVEGPAD